MTCEHVSWLCVKIYIWLPDDVSKAWLTANSLYTYQIASSGLDLRAIVDRIVNPYLSFYDVSRTQNRQKN